MNEVVARLLAIFDERADEPALVGEHGKTTYRDLLNLSGSIARHLGDQGLRPRDRFAVTLPNGPEFVGCYLAALWGGYTIVPIGGSLPEPDVEHIISVTRPAVWVRDPTEISTIGETTPPENSRVSDAAGIFFTSGTTNRPKGVQHRLASMLANAEHFNRQTGLDEEVRMLHVMPMSYMAGVLNTVLCPLVAGGQVVLAPSFDARTARGFWRPVLDHQANAMWITPTIAAFLTRLNRDESISRWTREHLGHVFVGTAPLPLTTAQEFEETFGIPCLQSYGMTEILLVSSNSTSDDGPTTVGRTLEGVACRFLDESGVDVPSRKGGALLVRTETALDGYLDTDSGNPDDPREDGWFATGDVGHLDDAGRLVITGRLKDLIIHGGANVSPTAVEEVLLAHPEVIDAGVTGVHHPFWGEEVEAHLVTEQDGPSVDELRIWCQHRLTTDAVPVRFRFRDSLPRTSTGKLQRDQLADDPTVAET